MRRHTTVFILFKASAGSPSLVTKIQLRMLRSQCYFLGVHGKLRLSFFFNYLLIAFFTSTDYLHTYTAIPYL